MSRGAWSSSRTFTASLRSGATLLRSSSRSAPVLRSSRMARRYPAPVEAPRCDRWAASGAMALTGLPDLPLGPPSGLVQGIDRLAGPFPGLDPLAVLGERAALMGLWRRGTTSCGGSCRLLPAATGWVAVSLPRGERHGGCAGLARARGRSADGSGAPGLPWPRALVTHDPNELVARAALLGLPVARVGEAAGSPAVARVPLGHGPARRPCRLPGRRPVRAVGGPSLRRPVGRRGGDRGQGGVNGTSRRRAARPTPRSSTS